MGELGRLESASCRAAALAFAILAAALGAPKAAAQSACGEGTPDVFADSGMNAPVRAVALFDDGTGEAVYVGGDFTRANGNRVSFIARWDGETWRSVSGGTSHPVHALAVFDDGTGPALFVGGDFVVAGGQPSRFVAKWTGTEWRPVGAGFDARVAAFAVHDAGTGPALFAGGSFGQSGDVACPRVARWTGIEWTATAPGLSGDVTALVSHDDGAGARLHAGGETEIVGRSYVARWDLAGWSAVETAASPLGPNGAVRALASADDGSGPALYAGGDFTRAGAVAAIAVARFTNGAWSAVGSGVGPGNVRALGSRDAAGTRRVLAAGSISHGLAEWTGTAWQPYRDGLAGVDAFVVRSWGDRRIVAAGRYDFFNSVQFNVAEYIAPNWRTYVDGMRSAAVRAMVAFDDGTGPAIYVGGDFRSRPNSTARHLARWDGIGWSSVGFEAEIKVRALTAGDVGAGRTLFASGESDGVGQPVRVYAGSGPEWTALGGAFEAEVNALEAHDDGGGAALYSGGRFASIDATPAAAIARWDGSSWVAATDPATAWSGGNVWDLLSFDDGSGVALYAAGSIPGGVQRWDGSAWTVVGPGLDAEARTLAVADLGAGPQLYAGGRFVDTADGSVSLHGIARWDGASWQPLGPGIAERDGQPGYVFAISGFDDGTGPKLYVGGSFGRAGALITANAAQWTGTQWTAALLVVSDSVLVMAPFEGDPAGDSLLLGGTFGYASGEQAHRIGRFWNPCALAARGTVNAGLGAIVDVLFVNGSRGDSRRLLSLATSDPISVTMLAPPEAATARFSLYAWRGSPSRQSYRSLPLGFGSAAMPMPWIESSPALAAVWNNTGKNVLGIPTLPSSAAPTEVVALAQGTRRPMTFFLQGIIADPGSAAAKPASVTNGLTVIAR